MAYTNIDLPAEYFNTLTWTGDSTTSRSITGVNFQPDFTWVKSRSLSASHNLVNSVIGSSYRLKSNGTTAEEFESENGYVSSFNSDGFTLAKGSSTDPTFTGWYETNQSGQTYVGWNWKANGAGVSNTDGTISSTVSANTTSGFSIVSYTGTGSVGTVGHGLGVAPRMIIVKNRDQGVGGWNWKVYHASLGNTQHLSLNRTDATQTSTDFWNNTSPTSTVFTLGTDGVVNVSSNNFIAYCFAEKKGYSKIGSYIGNGSTDGTFVYTGFKPAFVMLKVTDITNSWFILDNKRLGYNPTELFLNPNASSAESGSTGAYVDFTSNGFKWRTTSNAFNGSSNNYIYMAFASQPFTTSTGIPCTAR